MVEPQPSKLMMRVRFSPPAPVGVRLDFGCFALIGLGGSGVEHILGKDEVAGSIPALGSSLSVFAVDVRSL